MTRDLIFIPLLLALVITGTSQEDWSLAQLDSVLLITKDDILKTDILNELAWRYRITDQSLALHYADQAEAMALASGYQKGLGSSHVRKGLIQKMRGNYLEAEEYYQKALVIRTKVGDVRGVAAIYNNLGNMDNIQGEYDQAVTNFTLGLSHLPENKFARTKARLKNNIGESYYLKRDYINAISFFQESFTIRIREGDERGQMGVYLNLGTLYSDLLNFEKSLSNYNNGISLAQKLGNKTIEAKCSYGLGLLYLRMRNIDQSFKYLHGAAELEGYLEPKDRALLDKNFGLAYHKLQNYEMSQNYYEKAFVFFENTGINDEIIDLFYNIGGNYYALHNFEEAILSYSKSYELLQKSSNVYMETKVCHMISETYAALGRYDLAFEYGNLTTMLQDTINEKFQKVINFERNQQEALKNEANLALEITKNDQQALIIKGLVTAIGLGILAFISILAAYRSRQRRLMQEKESEQRVSNLLKDHEIRTTYARLEGQDAERQRISQDLHDTLGSTLSTVKLYFKAIDSKINNLKEENRIQYRRANELLDQAYDEVRKVAHDLQSGVLTNFGLKEELKALANSIKGTNQLNVEVVFHGLENRLDSATEVRVYKVIQELIANVMKHADATKLSIQLSKFKEILNIIVEDNGRGFIEKEALDSGGMGLRNVEARVLDLSGVMQIDSRQGRGTTISIDIPYSVNQLLDSHNEKLEL